MAIRTSALRALLVALVAALLALAFPRYASAGALRIRDDAHVLAGAEAEQLRSDIASAPFDARLVVTSDYAEVDDLSHYVGSLVDAPNVVAVGIDPRHRHVQVHFGRGSGIARADWAAIETAGNDDFRQGHWAAGAGAIFRTASHAVGDAPATPREQPAAAPSRVGSILLWTLLIGGGIAAFSFFARRRSGYGVGGPGYGGGPYGGSPYGGPSPGGMGPVGGGIVGAGLGGLAGYELGKLEGEREERVEREREYDDGRGRDDGNYDAGGGGSSWDDGGGGGGFDGGGGDSGGGSDF